MTARRLHPATFLGRWLKIIPQMAGGGAAYAAVAEQWSRILFFAALAGGIGLAIAILGWWRFRYTVEDREIVIESGILHRQRRVIPFDRVQDIALDRPLLARLFGTARVRIETGGARSDEGMLDMIGLEEARALRDRLRQPLRGVGDEAASVEAAPSERRLFELGMGRLLLSGAFNFSLLFLAVIFALLQNLEQWGLFEIKDWVTPERADAAAAQVTLATTLVLVLLLLLAGLLSGIARTVARDFGFRLTRTETGFRRRRGLVTLTDIVIPEARVQAAVIESGFVARRLGFHQIAFQTLGAERKEGGLQVAAPFSREEEIASILTEIGMPMPPPCRLFTRSPRRALAGPLLFFFLCALAAAAAALMLESRVGLALPFLFFAALLVLLRWRRRAYLLRDGLLFVSTGLLRRRLWIVPAAHLQTIMIGEGPLQRRLGLSTLLVDTAGASLIGGPQIDQIDRRSAAALAEELKRLFLAERVRRRGRMSPA